MSYAVPVMRELTIEEACRISGGDEEILEEIVVTGKKENQITAGGASAGWLSGTSSRADSTADYLESGKGGTTYDCTVVDGPNNADYICRPVDSTPTNYGQPAPSAAVCADGSYTTFRGSRPPANVFLGNEA